MVEQNNSDLHEGEKYLEMLGLSHLADREVTAAGRVFQARDFLDVCGDHARPMLAGFETLAPDDPRYETTRNALRGFISNFVEAPTPGS